MGKKEKFSEEVKIEEENDVKKDPDIIDTEATTIN